MFTIDGLTWRVPCKVQRVAEIRPSEISGMMLDRSWFNDVIGTYMQYTVSIAVPLNERDEYAQIYEALTNPMDGHAMTLPYNGGTIQITARIERVQDALVRLQGGSSYWKEIQFTAISNYPTKAMRLGEVVVTGREPFPAVSEPAEGAKYEYHNGMWVPGIDYDDADDNSY